MPEGRTRWTDDRVDDFIASVDRRFAAVDKRLNSMPDRLTMVEMAVRGTAEDAHECKEEIAKMHAAFTASRQGLSRSEKIALFGASAGFVGALAAAVAVLSGAGP